MKPNNMVKIKKCKPTFITAEIASQLLKSLGDHYLFAQWKSQDEQIHIRVRRCSRTSRGIIEPSGGLVFEAQGIKPSYSNYNPVYQCRLSVGWTEKQFYSRVENLYETVYNENVLNERRNLLFDMVKRFPCDDEFKSAVGFAEQKSGYSVNYSEMGEPELEFWTDWVREWSKTHRVKPLVLSPDTIGPDD